MSEYVDLTGGTGEVVRDRSPEGVVVVDAAGRYTERPRRRFAPGASVLTGQMAVAAQMPAARPFNAESVVVSG
jgi:hypothetical protein